MEAYESEIHQVFVKLLDGKHKILNFNVPSISVSALKNRIQTLTAIPSHLQLLLVDNIRVLYDHRSLNLSKSRGNLSFPEALGTDSDSQLIRDREVSGFGEKPVGSDGSGKFPVVVRLLLRLRGGKGGFGSLLRGAATKAGQKKTNNFDSCRDMNGRRLRHVNAEKKLEEWRAEAEERKLEKMADDFIKKKSKEVLKNGKSKGGDSAENYVAKYREDSAKCMEEVERSVRELIKGLSSSKRKSQAEGSGSTTKRLKIWMGKRKLGDSDSEDPDEDGSDEEEEENEKSVIINGGSHSDSSKEVEASSGSNSGGKPSGSADQGSSGNAEESFKSVKSLHECCENGNTKLEDSPMPATLEESKECTEIAPQMPDKSHLSPVNDVVSQQPETCGQDDIILSAAEVKDSSKSESVVEESVSMSESFENLDKPLNFDDYHSATELEVLGLERLKSELQSRGLKCGGTLQERAVRLFLLKTTPLEKLPKKLFAKK